MSFIKILLIAFGLILLGMLAFPLIGFIYQALWYLFWIAVLGVMGYVGYKILSGKSEDKLLEDKSPISLAGMKNVDRALEDFRRRHLTK
ncbi:MAG TPA: hypothetical protein VIL74_10210 [Pyrinomonadaceae bacterium]|jgi:membrane protein required for beta-lactamase induction